MHDLLSVAVEVGLKLLPCAACEHTPRSRIGLRGCSCRYCDDKPDECPACHGTGEDKSPWSIVGSVQSAGGVRSIGIGGSWVEVRYDVDGETVRARTVSHTGTPESIATAALAAWLRAQGREAPNA